MLSGTQSVHALSFSELFTREARNVTQSYTSITHKYFMGFILLACNCAGQQHQHLGITRSRVAYRRRLEELLSVKITLKRAANYTKVFLGIQLAKHL